MLAVILIEVVPVAVGVPLMMTVPLVSVPKVRPAGIAPTSVIVGVGSPVAVTANAPVVEPRVKKAALPVVIFGAAAATTVMVSARVAVLPDALVAKMLTAGRVPAVAVVEPVMVAVPLTGLEKSSPAGNAPVSVMVAAGNPVVVTVYVLE